MTYLVINKSLSIMVGEPISVKGNNGLNYVGKLLDADECALVIAVNRGRRISIRFENISSIDGQVCKEDSIKVHRG